MAFSENLFPDWAGSPIQIFAIHFVSLGSVFVSFPQTHSSVPVACLLRALDEIFFSLSGNWFSCVSFWNYWIQSHSRMTQFLGKKYCLSSECGSHRIKMTARRLEAEQNRCLVGYLGLFLLVQPGFSGYHLLTLDLIVAHFNSRKHHMPT